MTEHANLPVEQLHEDKRVKQPVRAASTATVTLATPGASLDGVTLSSGDRVLLKNQSTPSQNGIYVWTGAATLLARSTDADVAADFVYGFLIYVREGTANANTYWQFSQTAAITLETTGLTFTPFGGGAGTVTSVAMSVPAELTVSGSPVTSSGTLAVSKASVSANSVAAGPASGSAAAWAFRGLVAADLPAMGPSGAGHAAGAVPDPGAVAGSTRYLCETGGFSVPAGGGGGSGSGGSGSGAIVPIMVIGPLLAAQAALPFDGIPQTGFRNLRIVTKVACNGTGAVQPLNMTINSDGGANYGYTSGAATSGAMSATRATSQTAGLVGNVPSSTALASSAEVITIEIPLYTDTTWKKTWKSDGAGVLTAAVTGIERDSIAGQWESSAAITSIVLTPANGSVVAGSYACLYGEMDTAGVLLTPASNLLYEKIVGTAVATIDTGTLSQAYRDLRVVVTGQGTASATEVDVLAQFSGDTSSIYDWSLFEHGSTASAVNGAAAASAIRIGQLTGATGPAGAQGQIDAWIDSYSLTTFHKSINARATHKTANSAAATLGDLLNGHWRSTAAVTSIQFALSSGNFAVGCTIRVYGEPVSAGGAAVGTGTRVRLSGNQSITTATATAIGWGTTDSDADNQHYESAANLTGTVSKTAASATLTGTGTAFLTELSIGQVISVPGTAAEKRVVIAIDSNTSLRANTPYVNSASGQTAARVNSAVVFRQPGFYTCEAGVYSAALASGAVTLAFYLNSLTTATSGAAIGQRDPTAINASAGYDLTVQRPFQQWDFVEVVWTQNSGGSVNVLADERTHFSVGARPTVIVAVPYINIQDQKTSGTAGGTFTSGADQTRTLNTVDSDSAGIATLASNQFTLPDGTYHYYISAPGYFCNFHQALLYDVTHATEIKRGTSEYSANANAAATRSIISGRMRVSGAAAFEVRHRCSTTSSTNGFGQPASFGTEVYTVVELWKES